MVVLMVGPLRFYPTYTNGLLVHDFRDFFFLLSGQGSLPPYTLSGLTTKKNIIYECLPLFQSSFSLFQFNSTDVYPDILLLYRKQSTDIFKSLKWKWSLYINPCFLYLSNLCVLFYSIMLNPIWSSSPGSEPLF